MDKNRTVYEIATGASDYTKVNNIYDMAGNMWEWTTEERGYKYVANSSTGTFAVLRGGGFHNYGGSSPVAHRHGYYGSSWGGGFDFGFRVVLYINE